MSTVSDLAKDLLERYYGVGGASNSRQFLSIPRCAEALNEDQEKLLTERSTSPLNEKALSDEKESRRDDDDSNDESASKEYERSSRALDDLGDFDDRADSPDTFDIELGRNILCSPSGNSDSFIPRDEPSCDGPNEDAETNDLSLSFIEDPLGDGASDVSSIVATKQKSADELSAPLPPAPRKQPICNETYADFSNSGLTTFPIQLIQEFPSLRMLYLENNGLTELPDELFSNLRQLQWLDVRNNQLKSFPRNVKSHPSLETLLLQGNKIEALPLELCLVPKLKNLSVTQNPLTVPSEEIVALGPTSVLSFLRDEWNKLHPEERVPNKKKELEPKLSTILCYQSPREKRRPRKLLPLNPQKSEPTVREKSKAYRPSNRCKATRANSLTEQRAFWISKVKEMLHSQSSIIQREKDKLVLGDWRQDKRSYLKAMERAKSRSKDDAPFATDLTEPRRKRGSMKKRRKFDLESAANVDEFINELLESMNRLEVAENSDLLTPKHKQKALQERIQNIIEFQNEIRDLRKYSDRLYIKNPK